MTNKLQLRDLVTGETKTLDVVLDGDEINRLQGERIDSLPRYEQIGERPVLSASAVFFRNIESGEIKVLETDGDAAEIRTLKSGRTEDGRFPLWEQTSAGDADPELYSSAGEVVARRRWAEPAGLPVSDVTADGQGQSQRARRALDELAAHRGDRTKDSPQPQRKENR